MYKLWTIARYGVIDSKMLERFDPLWQAQNGAAVSAAVTMIRPASPSTGSGAVCTTPSSTTRAWLKNVMSMAAMVASAPIPCLKGFWEYRWMGSYLGTFMFIDRLFEGYRGPELVIAHMNMHAIVQSLTKKIALVLSNDLRIGGKDSDKIIPVDEVMPPLFLTGFKDLIPIPLQTLPEFIICDVDQQLEPYYIDVAESFGLPADVCSRCAAETGVALNDDFPLFGKAMISTNMPCNASEATSMFQRRRIGLPDFQATMAMIHNEPARTRTPPRSSGTASLSSKEYGVEYDWDALFERAKHMNEQNRIELEKWDCSRRPIPPSAALPRVCIGYIPGPLSTARRTSSLKTTARC